MELIIPYLKAFAAGGLICAAAQLLIDRTRLTPARILTLYVVTGLVLGAVGIYEPFRNWAGAGASIPLTGFGSTLAQGVRQAVEEKGVMGAFTGGFTASSAGVAAAIFFGLLVALAFRSKDKS